MDHPLVMLAGSVLLGYLLGALNPAALVARIKHANLREQNTKNLGATNTMLTFGLRWGILVLIVDMGKAICAVLLASHLFPDFPEAGLIAGGAAVCGHIFPFYLGFRGGKGLAPFLGMILAYDPPVFVLLLFIGIVLALVFNYSAAMPLSIAPLFPVAVWLRTKNGFCVVAAVATSLLVLIKHWGNLRRAMRREDNRVRQYIAEHWIRRPPRDGGGGN